MGDYRIEMKRPFLSSTNRSRLLTCVLASIVSQTTLCAQTTTAKPLFTEDFESGGLRPEIWSNQLTGDNIIRVQSDRVAHGKYALLTRCPAASNKTWAFISTHSLPDSLRTHHFGRAYVYITKGVPRRHTIFLTAGSAGFPKFRYEEVATANGKFQLTYVDQVDGGEDYHAGPELPVDRWICLEWEFSDDPNRAAIWVDGKPAYESAFTFHQIPGSKLVGGFTDFTFGFRLWGAAPEAFDIYYDDIAIGTERLGPLK